jgi:transcriptional antiterminator RfaH
VAFWACARLEPQRERLALRTLALAGYVSYLPRLRQQRISHGRRITTTPPLFPGYAFVLIELQWHTARWAFGVRNLIMDGMAPARVPEGVIAGIRARERDGLVELPRTAKYAPGARLRILQGPLTNHVGLYQGMKPHERVEVLLAILGGSQRVTLAADAVEAV